MLVRFLSLFCIFFCFFAKIVFGQNVAHRDEFISHSYQDWNYRCIASEFSEIPACELSQTVRVLQDDQYLDILNIALSAAEDKAGNVKWALIILTPQDVHLPSDFGLSFGRGAPILTRYRNCNQLGCWVVIPATSRVLNGMKRAIEGSAHLRLLDGQVVKVVFSLRGFTAGFNALAAGTADGETRP